MSFRLLIPDAHRRPIACAEVVRISPDTCTRRKVLGQVA